MKKVDIIALVPLFLCLVILDRINADTILVNNYNELYYVIENASQGDSIVIANGIYDHYQGVLPVRASNITIMSQSGNRDSVIINGLDMLDFGSQYGIGIFTTDSGDTLHNVTISDITIRNVGGNCIYSNTDIDSLRIINCKFADAGEQFIKIRSVSDTLMSENGIIENCLFEYSADTGPQYYIGGIEVQKGKNWIIRNNILKNIKSPELTAAQHAITFWNDPDNILVEKNLIINCDQGIRFGLDIRGNTGGIIRNNMIYCAGIVGESGISLHTSPGTDVYNNSIFIDGDYYLAAIEYRYSETQDIVISNNLTNKEIMSRNGAMGRVENNITDALEYWFTDVPSGDLHLICDTLSQVIDQGISIDGLSDDFDGDLRPQGSGIDIGADEYKAPSGIGLENNNIGRSFNLHQNYPNPFNPVTVINWQLAVSSDVDLSIYNILGQKVATLVSENQNAGIHSIEWNASAFSSGIYFYHIKAGDFVKSKRMLLIK
jgi:hypothetical protein